MDWTIQREGSDVVYVVDVPHVLADEVRADALARGLILTYRDHTLPLTLGKTATRALADGTRVTLHLHADHGIGRLRLSNGNLPDAPARIRRRVQVHRSLDVLEAPSTPQLTSPLARTLTVDVDTASALERIRRRLFAPAELRAADEPPVSTPQGFAVLSLLTLVGSLAAGVWARRRLPQSS